MLQASRSEALNPRLALDAGGWQVHSAAIRCRRMQAKSPDNTMTRIAHLVFNSCASSLSIRSFSAFAFLISSAAFCSGVMLLTALAFSWTCLVTCCTNCWIFLDLFLFFKPNVLSSATFFAACSYR